jgi:hypothetical protein
LTVFSGSYAPSDVVFLLRSIEIEPTAVDRKEEEIQSGRRHYAEMVSFEKIPDPYYLEIYEDALVRNIDRMALDTIALADAIQASYGSTITLVSLVRAGCPVGVLLKRVLARRGVDVEHYGVSIVRGIGIDRVAMRRILEDRPAESIVFVDGWTGKGAIAGQLQASLDGDLAHVRPRLAVLADPAGRAEFAASREDWLIPSGIMGAVVSGLVSRTIVDESAMRGETLHACKVWTHLADHDLSRSYVDAIDERIVSFGPGGPGRPDEGIPDASIAEAVSRRVVADVMLRSGVDDPNRVKPGIAEATRAVLRRVPDHVFVRDASDGDVSALIHLSLEAGVPVVEDADLCGPYRAITVIRKVAT